MSRPQKFNPSKGMQGNIEDSLWENQYRKNEINAEVIDRKVAISEEATARSIEMNTHVTNLEAAMVEAVMDEYEAMIE